MTTTTRPRRSRRNGTSAFSEQEKRMRKREQNRVAQQTYRRAQKERIKALEAAVAKSADTCTWGTLGDDDVLGNEILVLDYSADPPTTTTTTAAATSTSPVTISTGSGSTHAAQTLCDPLLDDLGLALDLNHRLSDGHGGSNDVTDCLEDILSGFAFQGDNLDSLPGIGTAAASTPATTKNTTACFTPHHHHDYDKDKEHDQQKPTSSELVVHQQIGDVSIRDASSASISENAGDTAMSLPEIEGVRAWKYSPDEYKVPQDRSCSSDAASNCSCSGMCPVSIIRCATSGSHDGTTGSPQAAMSRKHRRNKNTALHIAALASDSHMVQLLLERGADARLLNKDGQGPLHLAVMAAAEGERGHKDRQCKEDSGSPRAQDSERTIRLLLRALAAGTDPRRPGILDSLGRSLLFTAIATGSEAVVQMVLNAVGDESIAARTCGHSSSDPSTEDFEPDDVVRQAGIRALLEEPDAHGNFPLHIAAASGSTSMVMLLLSNGVDINQ